MSDVQLRGEFPLMSATEAAEFLLHVASERGAGLSHRRLQNLLYYAQGISHLSLQRLLYGEPIEARDGGPVVASVEDEYSRHGSHPIPVDPTRLPRDEGWYPGALIYSTDREFMSLSSNELTERILSERAWCEARATGLPIDASVVGRDLDERIQANRGHLGPKPTVKLRDHLRQHPDIADRIHHQADPEEMIPLL